MSEMDLSYVLPIRCGDGPHDHAELVGYLGALAAARVEVLVVDNSEDAIFTSHGGTFAGVARHLAPAVATTNGKVGNVLTGVAEASNERVVIADDDVRYDLASLHEVARRLEGGEVVIPANVFEPMPWHARWDTARTLLNRSLGRDFPGTLAVRRSRMLAMGMYDGDALFENLELMRTVRAHGGGVVSPLDLYVARVPPSAAHFWGQRTRQAYDDFALPLRMALWLTVVPLLLLSALKRRPSLALGPVAASIATAELGRRRAGGAAVFPATSSLLAPVWILERGVCAWLAVLQRLRFGGVRYGDSVIPVAAHSERQLRRRLAQRESATEEAGTGRQWSRRSNAAPCPTSTGSKTPASTGTSSRPSPA